MILSVLFLRCGGGYIYPVSTPPLTVIWLNVYALYLLRSGRRKKRNKDKLNAVVVPPLDAEDAAGELIEGDGDVGGDGEEFEGLPDMEIGAVSADADVFTPSETDAATSSE